MLKSTSPSASPLPVPQPVPFPCALPAPLPIPFPDPFPLFHPSHQLADAVPERAINAVNAATCNFILNLLAI